MGRKSRAKIEEEFEREQYRRYLKVLANKEYKSLWKELNEVNRQIV